LRGIRGLTVGLALLGLMGAIVLQRGWAWRQAKLDLLVEGPVPAAVQVEPAASGALLLFGDSRIAAWEPLPDRPFPVLRAGYPGQSAIRLAPEFARAIDESRPAAVFVQMGVNDAVAASLLPAEARATALAASLEAFSRVAALAEARDIALTIGLVVPPIRPGLARRMLYRDAVDSYVQSLNAALPGIAARHGARVVDPMEALRGADGSVPDAYRADALHWTPAAYAALNGLLPDRLPGAEREVARGEVPA
jgi:lysophospholipase L1-like esterase